MNEQSIQTADIKLIEFVIYVLENSRTKKHALNRLYGLLQKRREADAGCTVYTQEMINNYTEEQNKQNENKDPPNPP